jgi:hypothetical protein
VLSLDWPARAPVISAMPFVSVAFMIYPLCPPTLRLFREETSAAATPFAPSPVERSWLIRERRARLVNEKRAGLPDDLDCVGRSARFVRCGQRQALVGGERGHDPQRHSVLGLLGEGGDDTKSSTE